MEILGDDEQGLPTPPPRRWPIGSDDGRAPLVADAVDVTADGSFGYRPDTVPFSDPFSAPAGTAAAGVGSPGPFHGPEANGPTAPDDEGTAAPQSRFRFLLDVVTGPESLGLTGLLVILLGTMTSGFSPLFILLRPQIMTGVDSPAAVADAYGVPIGAAAALGAAFGLAALLRLRPSSPPFARAIAGGTFVFGALIVLVVGYAVWTADPTAPPVDTFQ